MNIFGIKNYLETYFITAVPADTSATFNSLYIWLESQFWNGVGVSLIIGTLCFLGPKSFKEWGKNHLLSVVVAMVAVPLIPLIVSVFKQIGG